MSGIWNLLRELVVKDLKIRYCRPALGFIWAFLLPLVTVFIFYVVFSLILKIEVKEAPFFLYLMSAIFTWRFFQDTLSLSVSSLVENKNLLKESRFPQYLIPFSIVLSQALNLIPSLVIIIIAAVLILKGLPVVFFFLPLVLLLHFAITAGLAIVVSILYVRWRDTKYLLEAAMLLIFYSTPVFYSLALVKASFGQAVFNLYNYNPFVGILNLYRITLLKGFLAASGDSINLFLSIVIPLISAAISLLWAYFLYKNNKDKINDHLSY